MRIYTRMTDCKDPQNCQSCKEHRELIESLLNHEDAGIRILAKSLAEKPNCCIENIDATWKNSFLNQNIDPKLLEFTNKLWCKIIKPEDRWNVNLFPK